MELLAAGPPAVPLLEALDQQGVWERYLPEWASVRSRPQRNAVHRFTVDRHLWEAATGAAALAGRVARPDLLLVGALLHDIGKGQPGDHTEAGVELIGRIAPRMGFDERDVEVLVTLCRLHLLLPAVATRRDIDDPATIDAVAEAVGSREVLELLAALTEADARATGPAAWTEWRAGLVRALVARVDHVLGGGDAAVAEPFPRRPSGAAGRGRTSVTTDDDRLTVVAPDRPGLFSRVAGVLAARSRRRRGGGRSEGGWAVEVFRAVQLRPDLQLGPGGGRRRPGAHGPVGRRRPAGRGPHVRPPPLVPRRPEVRFDLDASEDATVVGSTQPTPSACSPGDERGRPRPRHRRAKVQTLGPRVVDTSVRSPLGGKVTDGAGRGRAGPPARPGRGVRRPRRVVPPLGSLP